MTHFTFASMVVLLTLACVACSSPSSLHSSSSTASGGTQATVRGGSGQGPRIDTDGPSSSGGASANNVCAANQPGCTCPTVGQTAPCWTGTPMNRATGKCKDGVTECRGKEFGAWGPCIGEVLECGSGDSTRDAGKPVTLKGTSCARLAVFYGEQTEFRACALTSSGEVRCSGLHPGTKPVNLSNVRCISGGEDFVCALTGAGAVECWGASSNGAGFKQSPSLVAGLEGDVVDIAAGETHACVLLSSGTVECWGGPPGERNVGSWDPPGIPEPVRGLDSGVQAITSGDGFSCALLASGEVSCWGNNQQGELGNGTTNDSASPVTVKGLPSPALGVWADQATHPCALLDDGSVWCWGTAGPLPPSGLPQPEIELKPIRVRGFIADVTALTTGGEQSMSCALLAGGGVQCWGAGSFTGDLGDAAGTRASEVPVSVVDSAVVELRGTDITFCALMASGDVQCWGDRPGRPHRLEGT